MQHIGIDAYRKTWELFFTYQGKGGAFNLGELTISAGADVAFCHSIVTCGSDEGETFQIRLTVGLRKIDDAWLITHEHHSGVEE